MVCKFDVNLHFVSVSLMQVCIKLTLHKCKFDANLHQTYTQFCENCLCFSFSYYFLLFLIVLLVVLFIFCIFFRKNKLVFPLWFDYLLFIFVCFPKSCVLPCMQSPVDRGMYPIYSPL